MSCGSSGRVGSGMEPAMCLLGFCILMVRCVVVMVVGPSTMADGNAKKLTKFLDANVQQNSTKVHFGIHNFVQSNVFISISFGAI